MRSWGVGGDAEEHYAWLFLPVRFLALGRIPLPGLLLAAGGPVDRHGAGDMREDLLAVDSLLLYPG